MPRDFLHPVLWWISETAKAVLVLVGPLVLAAWGPLLFHAIGGGR